MSDPFFSNVVSLLHFDGTNGQTTTTDVIGNSITLASGFALTTANFKFGTASVGNSASTNAGVQIATSSALQPLGNDTTIECWVRKTDTFGGTIFEFAKFTSTPGTISFSIIDGTRINFTYGTQNSGFINYTFPLNQFVHVALTRSGSSIRAFVNGVQVGTTLTFSGVISNTFDRFTVGAVRRSGNSFNSFIGQIDEFRYTNGIARYTANFTPSTTPFPDVATRLILVSDAGPLGNINALGYIEARALASDAGPLGAELILTQQWAGLVSAPSVLGPEQFVTRLATFGRASAPSMLGNENFFASHLFALANASSMLGETNLIVSHDFTLAIGNAITYYVMDLTTPSGVVRVPISSWQATLQTGLSNYVQCVVPAVQDYVSSINAATQFKISRLVSVPGLPAPLTYEMARGPVQTTTFDRGPFRYTCTISGYSAGFAPNETPNPAYNRTMQGIRSISINQGGRRVRCAIDWLLRPAQRAIADTENFVVSYINYFVGGDDAYMEIGERA